MSKHPLGPWTEITASSKTFPGEEYIVNGYPQPNQDGPVTFLLSATRTGVNNGYHDGKKPTVPSSASLVETFVEARRCDWHWAGNHSYKKIINLPVNPTAMSDNKEKAKALAFQKLIQKQQSALTGLVSLGEIKETVGTFAQLANLIVTLHNGSAKSLVKRLIKHRRAAAPAIARIIADATLTVNFGIKPLISDIENLIEDIDRTQDKSPPSKVIRSKWIDRQQKQVEIPWGFGYVQGNCKALTEVKTLVKMGYTIRLDKMERVARNRKDFGLGFEDIIPTLYELTPYSWLLDYFTNTGDYVNLASLLRGTSENGWIVVIEERKDTKVSWAKFALPQYPMSGSPGVVAQRSFTFNRDPFDVDTYVPEFQVRVPSIAQAGNILALATSRLLKPRNMTGLYGSNKAREINHLMRGEKIYSGSSTIHKFY